MRYRNLPDAASLEVYNCKAVAIFFNFVTHQWHALLAHDFKQRVGSTFWFTAWIGRGRGDQSLEVSTVSEGNIEALLRARYAGTRILLVEDNAVNQAVALQLLNTVGLSVDSAVDGRAAVVGVQATRYDLVLMDVQMPVMDGLEATRIMPGWFCSCLLLRV